MNKLPVVSVRYKRNKRSLVEEHEAIDEIFNILFDYLFKHYNFEVERDLTITGV